MRKKLIQLRKAAKLTETSIARRMQELTGDMGMNRHYYSEFEKGSETSVKMKDTIRQVLNCDDADLFEDTNE